MRLLSIVLTTKLLSNLSHSFRAIDKGYLTSALLSLFSVVILCAYGAEEDVLKHQEIIHTRTLAASCAACHGTNGNSQSITPVLAGLDASYFSTQMQAFKNGSRDSTVMHRHAKGLTISEIDRLAIYFSQQKRVSTPAPVSQRLKARNE